MDNSTIADDDGCPLWEDARCVSERCSDCLGRSLWSRDYSGCWDIDCLEDEVSEYEKSQLEQLICSPMLYLDTCTCNTCVKKCQPISSERNWDEECLAKCQKLGTDECNPKVIGTLDVEPVTASTCDNIPTCDNLGITESLSCKNYCDKREDVNAFGWIDNENVDVNNQELFNCGLGCACVEYYNTILDGQKSRSEYACTMGILNIANKVDPEETDGVNSLAIVAGVFAGLFFIAIGVVGFLVWKRKKQTDRNGQNNKSVTTINLGDGSRKVITKITLPNGKIQTTSMILPPA